MTYIPNWSDPRIRRRIKRAMGFASACISPIKEHSWSSLHLDKWFGKSSNELSKFLRNRLLICTDEHYSKLKNISKKYRLNLTGMSYLQSKLTDLTEHIVQYPCVIQVDKTGVEWAKEEFKDELSTRVFRYEHKSSRNWHPLQRAKRAVKRVVFRDAGLKYQYDIQCCAPRLLLQYSHQISEVLDPELVVGPQNNKRPAWLQGPMDLWLSNMQAYLKDRTQIRTELALRSDISAEQAKEIINALFAGARIALHEDSAVYQLLEGDIAKIHYLKQDPFLTGLREEIKTMWEYIRPVMSKRTITTKTGQERLLPISSKQKWNLYFELEHRVLNAITDYLTLTDNQFFTEHDGWSCVNEVDQIALREYVMTKTGFDIRLDLEIL